MHCSLHSRIACGRRLVTESVAFRQIIGILREQEAEAKTVNVCRKHGISSATFYKWKAKYGGRGC